MSTTVTTTAPPAGVPAGKPAPSPAATPTPAPTVATAKPAPVTKPVTAAPAAKPAPTAAAKPADAEPSAAAEPISTSAPPADGELSLERIVAAWPDIVATLSQKPAIKQLILTCRPVHGSFATTAVTAPAALTVNDVASIQCVLTVAPAV